jgi:hypothetical protein
MVHIDPYAALTARYQSGWLRCHKFQKSARARAESGVQTRRKAANLADRMLELSSTLDTPPYEYGRFFSG